MQNLRMTLTAIIVLTVLLGAFSFKPFGAGTIFCVPNSSKFLVIHSLSCFNSAQPNNIRIDFRTSTNPAHSTANPCPVNETPFDGSLYQQCIEKTPGTDRFTPTLP